MALYAFNGTWNPATLNDELETAEETNVPDFYEAYDDHREVVRRRAGHLLQ